MPWSTVKVVGMLAALVVLTWTVLITSAAPAPTVTGLSPTSGPTAGGNSVVITGTDFTGAAGVSFGGTAATSFVVDSGTQITAVAPAHAAGTVDVSVTTVDGTSANTAADDYTYVAPVAAPAITGLDPTSGPLAGGDSVVISGTDFTGATAVTFGGTAATSFVVDSATKITAVAPAHAAGAVDVAVTTPAGTSANTDADDYTYGDTASTPEEEDEVGGEQIERIEICHKPGTPAEQTLSLPEPAVAAHLGHGGEEGACVEDDVTLPEEEEDVEEQDEREKIAVCHKPGTPAEKTLWLPEPAVSAHLGHGDDEGECSDQDVGAQSRIDDEEDEVEAAEEKRKNGGPPGLQGREQGQGAQRGNSNGNGNGNGNGGNRGRGNGR